MHWIHIITLWLRDFATQVPLEIFVFVGSFIEELIGPIPSTVVMTTAGVFARLEGHTLVYVFWLAILGNVGKTLATYVYYFIGDKLEDVVVRKYGRYFKIKHEDIEKIGSYFGKSHWQDGTLLFIARLIPFFPTLVVSVGCGVIKMDVRVYLLATYLGNFGKDLLYIYAGFAGVRLLPHLWRGADSLSFQADVFFTLLFIIFLVVLYIYRHKGKRFLHLLAERYLKKEKETK